MNLFLFYQVATVRNTLSHMKISDNLHMEEQEMENSFQALNDLLDDLIMTYPNHFQNDILQKVNGVSISIILLFVSLMSYNKRILELFLYWCAPRGVQCSANKSASNDLLLCPPILCSEQNKPHLPGSCCNP